MYTEYYPPAFPQPTPNEENENNWGMTLLDYFAGQIIPRMVGGGDAPETNADIAYRQAAAMMKERKKYLQQG